MTHLIVGGLRTTFPKLKSKEYTTLDKYPTTTALYDTGQHIYKAKASTQQPIPLKINAFCFTKNGEPRPNESGRVGYMEDTIEVANICSIFLDAYIYVEQQVLSFFKAVPRRSLFLNVKSTGFIVQSK